MANNPADLRSGLGDPRALPLLCCPMSSPSTARHAGRGNTDPSKQGEQKIGALEDWVIGQKNSVPQALQFSSGQCNTDPRKQESSYIREKKLIREEKNIFDW